MAENIQSVDTSKMFKQRLADRLCEGMGELMPDEDLRKIVDRGIAQALFEPRASGIGYDRATHPPLVQAIVEKELSVRVHDAVRAWIKENPDRFEAAIQEAFRTGMLTAVMQSFDNLFQNDLRDTSSRIMDQVRNLPNRSF